LEKEAIEMKKRYSMLEESEIEAKKSRKHCPDCCFYMDGQKEETHDGGTMFFNIPGMQFHRKKNGTLYEVIGTAVPCHCQAGYAIGEEALSKTNRYET
jgi:hypothetical protein